MRTVCLLAIWGFVSYVAIDDGHFAWQHRDDLATWEVNPLARWMASELGVEVLLGFKVAGLAFAFAIAAYCRVRQLGLEKWLTCVAGAVYLVLFLQYAMIRFPHTRILRCSAIPP
jgi:hypothetical protein